MATVALIVDWCGPFETAQAASRKADEHGFTETLYIASGKLAYQRNPSLQYVGISNNPRHRLANYHHALEQVTREARFWIGEISSHGIAGRRAAGHPVAHSRGLRLAEWTLAYFLQMSINTQLRRTPPSESVVLYNRWWQADFETRRRRRGDPEWPDFIEYEKDYATARLQWFGAPGRCTNLTEAGIRALAA